MRVSFNLNKFNNVSYNGLHKKRETVAVLGSSKETKQIENEIKTCKEATKNIVLSDRNILTGCGSYGIMGAAYNSGKKYSIKDSSNKPIQNKVIVKAPLWGDEDLENCSIISYADSEAERIEKFYRHADKFLIFPGGPGTMQEVTTLINKNHYSNPQNHKQIVLVGRDFYKGLIEQYQKLYDTGLSKFKPEELFTVIDSEEEIINQLDKK